MKLVLALVATAPFALIGCDSAPSSRSDDTPTQTATPATLSAAQQTKVDTAAMIAKAIERQPDSADQVLAQHGMTEAQFEDLIYEIAGDPAMSAAYTVKLGG